MVYLLDYKHGIGGHFEVFQSSLLTIENTQAYNLTVTNEKQNGNKLLLLYHRIMNWRRLISLVPKKSTVHILYADLFYTIPFLFSLGRGNKYILTMHSFPNGKIKHFLMRRYCNMADCVIVHSKYTEKQIKRIGVSNVHLAYYPSFYDYSQIKSKGLLRKKYNIGEKKCVLSALGGIRYDKGLDILLQSFRYLTDSVRCNILLNICGKPGFMNEEEIYNICIVNKINAKLTIRVVNDVEFMENVLISDYLVLPYRKDMTANSGPMTEGIVNHIPSIVPNIGNLADMALSNHVGRTFKSEDPKDLARVITEEFNSPSKFDFSFAKELTLETYIKKNSIIYKSFSNE